jgi:hypothetical protein
MTIVTGITSQPKQQLSLVLDDGSTVTALLEYRPQQIGWFADFTWGSWIARGVRLTSSPNMLRQYRQVIPFGLAIIMANNVDPLNVADFADGSATVFLLNPEDVQLVEDSAFVGN